MREEKWANRPTQVIFRPSTDIHEALKKRAHRNRRTMGAEVELMVIKALVADGEIKPEAA